MAARRRASITLTPGSTTSLVLQTFRRTAERQRMMSRGDSAKRDRSRAPPDLLQSIINSSALQPGCFQGDDGSSVIADRYNFFAHGKRFLFAPCSLGIFTEANRFRQALIWCITWKRFDQFVLLLILGNSMILAVADYSKVDANGDLDATLSYRNALVNGADSVFTFIFALECTMKIIAMGLVGDEGAYLMDPWNLMDFVVVFVGILAVIPGIPNVSALRTFRVLRPLRSLNAVAGIKKLVSSLLHSIPELLTVVAFLSFLFFLYGVIGVQLWSGVLHSRCRLTPYPVRLDSNVTFKTLPAYQEQVLQNYSLFPCADADGTQILLENETSHDSSPWTTPRMCYWPIAVEAVPKACNLGASYRQCPRGQTCGSDYDNFGNFRFTHPDAEIEQRVLLAATYNAPLTWGYVNFDHIGTASLTIFVCITRDGWSDIMYTLEDAGFGVVSVIYFVSFLLFGSYFMLNLTLAVIWDNFSEASLVEAEERRKLQRKRSRLMEDRSQHNALGEFQTGSVIRLLVQRALMHWVFNTIRTVLILLNTIILSLDKYPSDEKLDSAIEIISFGLTLAFLLEWILKVIGMGWKFWARDKYNWLDALVVVLGITELVVSPPKFWPGDQTNSSAAASFSGLRSVRLFALFKLARQWPSLQKLLSTMLSTIREVGNFGILFLLFVYIYSLIGMQTFANQFRFDNQGFPVHRFQVDANVPRANFDTLLWSSVTVFQILTGEAWNAIMYDGWRSSGWWAVMYFVSLVIIGTFIVLNLFLAILLGNFEESSNDEKKAMREEWLKRASVVVPSTWQSDHSSQSFREDDKPRTSHQSRPFTTSARSRRESTSKVFDDGGASHRRVESQKNALKPTGRSLFVFSPCNPIRKFAFKLIAHPQFDNVSLALIAVSTVSLAIDNPLHNPDSVFVSVLSWNDSILTSLFLGEVVVKIIAQGFLFAENAYLRNNWNVMDFVITALASFSLSDGSGRFKFVKTLRTFRALRPLRMINRNPGLKLVVSSLIASIPQILNVIVVCVLVFTIFSILAVNNLKGKLYSCSGNEFDALTANQQSLITYPRLWTNLTSTEKNWFNATAAVDYQSLINLDDVTSRAICGLLGATWGKTINQDFDNVLHGIQVFFEMTTVGWVDVMLVCVDATEIDMQPIRNHREIWTLFFVAYIMVGSFFVLQLFIGVVIENFNRMKEKLDGTLLLSAPQREWLMVNEAMLNLRPARKMKRPQAMIRRVLFRIAHSALFEIVITGCIVLNTVIMALHYFGEDDLYRDVIDYANYTFAVIFAMEAAIKIIGLGRYYWKDSWNIFDFTIVMSTCAGFLYQMFGGNSLGIVATTVRSFRVGRLFRLIQSAPSLRQLFNTLLITLPSLVNIGGLLFLVFFIYAAMGVQLFAKVKFGAQVTYSNNFQSMTRAMVTLIRCATGEAWNDLMYELASQTDCQSDPSYDPNMCGFNNVEGCQKLNGCGTPVAFLYFYTFQLVVPFILLNIFIAIILEGFANEKERVDGILRPHHYENFVNVWSTFDPEATGFIPWHLLPQFLAALTTPMGYGLYVKPSQAELAAYVEVLDLPIFRGNKVFFNDVARRVGKVVIEAANEEPLEALPSTLHLEQQWRRCLNSRNVRKNDLTVFRLNHFSAATLIHDEVKALLLREDIKKKVQRFTALAAAASRTPNSSTPETSSDGDKESCGSQAS